MAAVVRMDSLCAFPTQDCRHHGPHLVSEPHAWPPRSARARRGLRSLLSGLLGDLGVAVLPGGPRHTGVHEAGPRLSLLLVVSRQSPGLGVGGNVGGEDKEAWSDPVAVS